MADILAESFEQLRKEEKAQILAAQARAVAILAQGDSRVRERWRMYGLMDDREWLLKPQDDARVDAACCVFVAFVNVYWDRTDPMQPESVRDFVEKLYKTSEGVLAKYGYWECRDAITTLRATSEQGAWLKHAEQLKIARVNETISRQASSGYAKPPTALVPTERTIRDVER